MLEGVASGNKSPKTFFPTLLNVLAFLPNFYVAIMIEQIEICDRLQMYSDCSQMYGDCSQMHGDWSQMYSNCSRMYSDSSRNTVITHKCTAIGH